MWSASNWSIRPDSKTLTTAGWSINLMVMLILVGLARSSDWHGNVEKDKKSDQSCLYTVKGFLRSHCGDVFVGGTEVERRADPFSPRSHRTHSTSHREILRMHFTGSLEFSKTYLCLLTDHSLLVDSASEKHISSASRVWSTEPHTAPLTVSNCE